MSNLTIHSKNALPNSLSTAKTPLKKSTDGQVDSFDAVLKNSSTNKINVQAALTKPTTSQPLSKVSDDGHFIIGKDLTVTGVLDLKPVTVESLQKELGVSKAKAEELLKPVTVESLQNRGLSKAEAEDFLTNVARATEVPKDPTPQEGKAYMMSKVVESVARDNDGNIVAKLYKDGSFMSSNHLAGAVDMGDGRSNEKIMQQIEKQPNVTVTHYKDKVTDFDLLPEEIANAKKQLLLPEPYYGYNQTVRESIASNERLLAL